MSRLADARLAQGAAALALGLAWPHAWGSLRVVCGAREACAGAAAGAAAALALSHGLALVARIRPGRARIALALAGAAALAAPFLAARLGVSPPWGAGAWDLVLVGISNGLIAAAPLSICVGIALASSAPSPVAPVGAISGLAVSSLAPWAEAWTAVAGFALLAIGAIAWRPAPAAKAVGVRRGIGRASAAGSAGLLAGAVAVLLPSLLSPFAGAAVAADLWSVAAILALGALWSARLRAAWWAGACAGLCAAAAAAGAILPATPEWTAMEEPASGGEIAIGRDAGSWVAAASDPLDDPLVASDGRRIRVSPEAAWAETRAVEIALSMSGSSEAAVLLGPIARGSVAAAERSGAERAIALPIRPAGRASLPAPEGRAPDRAGAAIGLWPFAGDPAWAAALSPRGLDRWRARLEPSGAAALLVRDSGSEPDREAIRRFEDAFSGALRFALIPGEAALVAARADGGAVSCLEVGGDDPASAIALLDLEDPAAALGREIRCPAARRSALSERIGEIVAARDEERAAAEARASGNAQRAIARARLALQINPRSGWARAALGGWLLARGARALRTGRLAAAEADLSETVALLDAPEHRARAHLGLARVFADLGRPAEAEKHLGAAAALAPDLPAGRAADGSAGP